MTITNVLPPPRSKQRDRGIKNPIGLIIDCIELIIVFFLSIYKSIYHLFLSRREKNITDKVVLITGTGRGLGRELALTFASKGCKVACAEIQTELNDETVKLVNEKYPNSCKGYYCDVGKYESCEQLKKEVWADFGQVDILVNNAAVVLGGSILSDIKPSVYEGIMKVNLLSHFWTCKVFLPEMLSRNSGHIVCISSLSAVMGLGNASGYTACKWAVTGFMESIREEIRTKNPKNKIQFSTVMPYFINTSAYYVENWNVRIPELSARTVAREIVKGVRQNKVIFSVPNYQYFPAVLIKLFPQAVKDKFCDIFFAKINEVKMEEVKNLANYKIAAGEYKK